MLKLMSFLMVVAFAAAGLADAEVPLPGPGAPPTEPPPPQPSPPLAPTPTPPPNEPWPTPWPTPYPTPQPNPGDNVTYTLGSGQVGRFKERSFSFRPPFDLNNIRALRITCTNSKIKIKNVKVQFASGHIQDQSLLTGTYSLGNSRTSYIYHGKVSKVTVTAESSSIFKTNGAFRLDAAAVKTRAHDADEPEQHEDEFEFESEDAGAF